MPPKPPPESVRVHIGKPYRAFHLPYATLMKSGLLRRKYEQRHDHSWGSQVTDDTASPRTFGFLLQFIETGELTVPEGSAQDRMYAALNTWCLAVRMEFTTVLHDLLQKIQAHLPPPLDERRFFEAMDGAYRSGGAHPLFRVMFIQAVARILPPDRAPSPFVRSVLQKGGLMAVDIFHSRGARATWGVPANLPGPGGAGPGGGAGRRGANPFTGAGRGGANPLGGVPGLQPGGAPGGGGAGRGRGGPGRPSGTAMGRSASRGRGRRGRPTGVVMGRDPSRTLLRPSPAGVPTMRGALGIRSPEWFRFKGTHSGLTDKLKNLEFEIPDVRCGGIQISSLGKPNLFGATESIEFDPSNPLGIASRGQSLEPDAEYPEPRQAIATRIRPRRTTSRSPRFAPYVRPRSRSIPWFS